MVGEKASVGAGGRGERWVYRFTLTYEVTGEDICTAVVAQWVPGLCGVDIFGGGCVRCIPRHRYLDTGQYRIRAVAELGERKWIH